MSNNEQEKNIFTNNKLLSEIILFEKWLFSIPFIVASVPAFFDSTTPFYKSLAVLSLGLFLLPKINTIFDRLINKKYSKYFKYFIVCFLFACLMIENKSDFLLCFFGATVFIPFVMVSTLPFFGLFKLIIFLKNKIAKFLVKPKENFTDNNTVTTVITEKTGTINDKNSVAQEITRFIANIFNPKNQSLVNSSNNKPKKKNFFQEHKERDLAVREKVNEMATQYVDQFIVGNYPKHKIFNKEDISIFETIARDALTDLEAVHLRNIGIRNILQIKYNNQSYSKFKERFVIDNNLISGVDFKSLILAYLNTFDENLDWIYYFVRYVREERINALNIDETTNWGFKFQLKLNHCHAFCGQILKYLEKGDYENSIICDFIKEFSEFSQEIIHKMQFEQKVKLAKNNMETGGKIGGTVVTIDEIDRLDGFSFEHLLGKLFKQMNYTVEVTRGSGDQGADIIISKMGRKTVVQAKCYLKNVSNKAVQEVVAAMKYYNAESGIVVTNSYYTKGAKELAEANNIVLWDRDKLAQTLLAYPVILENVNY